MGFPPNAVAEGKLEEAMEHRERSWSFQAIVFISSTLFLSACAGPATPFGAIDTLYPEPMVREGLHAPDSGNLMTRVRDESPQWVEEAVGLMAQNQAEISFFPPRQNLHDLTPISIRIRTPEPVSEDFILRFSYNTLDITDKVMERAELARGSDGRTLEIFFPDLRLPSDRFHAIEISFAPSAHSRIYSSRYEPPSCHLHEMTDILKTGRFDPPRAYLDWIEGFARDADLNPSLLAGLIAQESGFDREAVSWAKAIGLTQVTQLAEEQVLQMHPDWPRNALIPDQPAPIVRALIEAGEISRENEWRLNPEYSIRGGVTFLQYLVDYWTAASRLEGLNQPLDENGTEFVRVLLASYNSGAARVKYAIKLRGWDWLSHESLGEARRYVNRVMSYCYHFSDSGVES